MLLITGTFNITLESVTISAPPHEAFFSAAEQLIRGVVVLAAEPNVDVAHSFLAGQALECLLKAYLSKNGTSLGELRSIRHDIENLWEKSNQGGLSIASELPQWAQCLNRLHKAPYNLRYPIGLNGLVLPGAQPMTSELEVLLTTVQQAIRQKI
jgi:HEPN domain-containing protein